MSTYQKDPSYNYNNPSTDPTVGTGAGYQPSYSDERRDVGTRGADKYQTNVNTGRGDVAAGRSDYDTGQVSQGQGDVFSGMSEGDRTTRGGTRGARGDAFRQEGGLDAGDFNQ